MKYFTMERWIADQDLDSEHDPYEPLRAYRAYLTSVHEQLPSDFRRMLAEVCIHDAALLELNVDLANHRVILRLNAGDVTMREGRRVQLTYEGALTFTSTADRTSGLPGPHGYGDLGNDEIEVLPDGTFAHRMIFSSGIELDVRFATFRFDVLPNDRGQGQ